MAESDKRKSEGIEFESLIRGKLKELAPSVNLNIYPSEYTYNYKKLEIPIGKNLPSCDIAISDNKDLFLIEVDTKGTPTWNAVKVWFYIKRGGRFDEWKKPEKIHLLHFVSENVSNYDFLIAQELASETEELAHIKLKEQGIVFQYDIERFTYGRSESREDVVNNLCKRIINKLQE